MTTTWGRLRRSAGGRRGRAALASVIGASVLLLLGAGPAAAHAKVVSTNPADGSVVAAVPAALTVTFDEPMLTDGQGMVVTMPTGDEVTLAATIAGATLTAAGPAGGLAGTYTVSWRAVSDDGHPLSGTFAFGVKGDLSSAPASPTRSGAAPPIPSATTNVVVPSASDPPTPSDAGGSTPWGLVFAGVTLAGVVLAAVVIARRGGQEL